MIELRPVRTINDVCTVALPVWKMQDIVWLQIESLCAQQDAGPWELIVSECEGHSAFAEVKGAIDRLQRAGMTSFRYIENTHRLPLGIKWRQIAMAAEGDTMLLCAGDNYSPANRIALTRQHIGEYDWFDVSSGLFYDIRTGQTGQWTRKHPGQSGLWMATKTEFMRALRDDPPQSSIDGWIKSQLTHRMRWMRYPGPLNGLHTDGSNTISRHRSSLYNAGPKHGNFSRDTQDISTCAPAHVLERLRGMTREWALAPKGFLTGF